MVLVGGGAVGGVTLPETNMAMENHHLYVGKICSNWSMFQPAMLVFLGV